MSVSRDEVRRIARLAHLEYPPNEDPKAARGTADGQLFDEAALDQLARDLNQILRYVEILKGVDVTGVEPMRHPVTMPTRFRGDEPGPTLPEELGLKAAPRRIGNEVLVPRIVE